jgi:tetratricopeptide (TPR) repeat protein
MHNQRVERQEVVRQLTELEPLVRQALSGAADAVGKDPAFFQELLALNLAALHHFSLYDRQPQGIANLQEESLQLIQGLPDTEAKAYTILMNCRGPSGLSVDQRLDLLQQCYTIFKHINDPWGAALVRVIWADVVSHDSIDLDLARVAYQASLQVFEAARNLWGQALCLNGLAYVENKVKNHVEAFHLFNRARTLFSQLSNFDRVAEIHHTLGEIAISQGKISDALRHFEANRAYFEQQGDQARYQYYQERVSQLDKGDLKT